MAINKFASINGRIASASFEVSHLIGLIGNEKEVPQLIISELTEIVVRLDTIQEMLLAVSTDDKEQLELIIDEYKSQGFKRTIDHHIETQDKPLPWVPYKKIDLLKQQFLKDETLLVLDVDKLPWTAYYEDGRWKSTEYGNYIKGVTHYMRIEYPHKEVK